MALAAPDWLLAQTLPHWASTYERRAFDDRLPGSATKRDVWLRMIGNNGHYLLDTLSASPVPAWLSQLPAVIMLRRVWVQQFYLDDEGAGWRTEREGIPSAAKFISSPSDADARYARKSSKTWIGRWCTLRMEEEITSIHGLLSNDLPATDRLRASGRQHPVQDRHANGSLGLLGRETAGS